MSTRTIPLPSPGGPVLPSARGLLQALAFWAAVVLPVSYVPLLVRPGTNGSLLAVLLVANVVCLLVGHDYADR